jgi:lincosamide nucleotidyltransferase A/C/D/E
MVWWSRQGMSASDVLEVLNAIRSTGRRCWLEGGWGVDALVGRLTRPHRDVGIDFYAAFEGRILGVLMDTEQAQVHAYRGP